MRKMRDEAPRLGVWNVFSVAALKLENWLADLCAAGLQRRTRLERSRELGQCQPDDVCGPLAYMSCQIVSARISCILQSVSERTVAKISDRCADPPFPAHCVEKLREPGFVPNAWNSVQ